MLRDGGGRVATQHKFFQYIVQNDALRSISVRSARQTPLMKWLLTLSAIQTVLLAMLGLHALKLDMRADDIADSVKRLDMQMAAAPDAAPAQWTQSSSANVDADNIRAIIREELERIAADGALQNSARPAATAQGSPQSAAAPAPAYDKTQTLMTQAAIDQDLDRYAKRGAISALEMDQLHAKIAELPPEARRAALIRLTKAINSGEIKGQF
ncbi:MAG: hypothetical protein CMI63_08160 [Parvularcula sp.]|nr:hypothetical protein [Parvularcula sp.]